MSQKTQVVGLLPGLQAHKAHLAQIAGRPLSAFAALLPVVFALKSSSQTADEEGGRELPILAVSLMLLSAPALLARPGVAAMCYLGRSALVASIGLVSWLPCVPQGTVHLTQLCCETLLEVLLSCLGATFLLPLWSQAALHAVHSAAWARMYSLMGLHGGPLLLRCVTMFACLVAAGAALELLLQHSYKRALEKQQGRQEGACPAAGHAAECTAGAATSSASGSGTGGCSSRGLSQRVPPMPQGLGPGLLAFLRGRPQQQQEQEGMQEQQGARRGEEQEGAHGAPEQGEVQEQEGMQGAAWMLDLQEDEWAEVSPVGHRSITLKLQPLPGQAEVSPRDLPPDWLLTLQGLVLQLSRGRLLVTGGSAQAGCILITLHVLELAPEFVGAGGGGGGSASAGPGGAGGCGAGRSRDGGGRDGAGPSGASISVAGSSSTAAEGDQEGPMGTGPGDDGSATGDAALEQQLQARAAQVLLPLQAKGLTTRVTLSGPQEAQAAPGAAADSPAPTQPQAQLVALHPAVAAVPHCYRPRVKGHFGDGTDGRDLSAPLTLDLTARVLLPPCMSPSCLRGWQPANGQQESPGAGLHGQAQTLVLSARCMDRYMATQVLACTEAAHAAEDEEQEEQAPNSPEVPAGHMAVNVQVQVTLPAGWAMGWLRPLLLELWCGSSLVGLRVSLLHPSNAPFGSLLQATAATAAEEPCTGQEERPGPPGCARLPDELTGLCAKAAARGARALRTTACFLSDLGAWCALQDGLAEQEAQEEEEGLARAQQALEAVRHAQRAEAGAEGSAAAEVAQHALKTTGGSPAAVAEAAAEAATAAAAAAAAEAARQQRVRARQLAAGALWLRLLGQAARHGMRGTTSHLLWDMAWGGPGQRAVGIRHPLAAPGVLKAIRGLAVQGRSPGIVSDLEWWEQGERLVNPRFARVAPAPPPRAGRPAYPAQEQQQQPQQQQRTEEQQQQQRQPAAAGTESGAAAASAGPRAGPITPAAAAPGADAGKAAGSTSGGQGPHPSYFPSPDKAAEASKLGVQIAPLTARSLLKACVHGFKEPGAEEAYARHRLPTVANSYVWLLSIYSLLMISVFFIELGVAGLRGFPVLCLVTVLPLLPCWLAALGAAAPAGSKLARYSSWAMALPALLRPKQRRSNNAGISSGHTGISSGRDGTSASARLAALEWLMLYGTTVYLAQPKLSMVLVPGITNAWMERRCRSMDPPQFIAFFPPVMATGEQVRFWALPVQSLLYTAFVAVVRTMGQCGTWQGTQVAATGVGCALFCWSMALDCRSRWLFAKGRRAAGAAAHGAALTRD